jgi:hypothetical protein
MLSDRPPKRAISSLKTFLFKNCAIFLFKTQIFPSKICDFYTVAISSCGHFSRARAERGKSATRQPTLFVRVARRLSPHVDQLKQVCLVLDITGENQKHISKKKNGSPTILWAKKGQLSFR